MLAQSQTEHWRKKCDSEAQEELRPQFFPCRMRLTHGSSRTRGHSKAAAVAARARARAVHVSRAQRELQRTPTLASAARAEDEVLHLTRLSLWLEEQSPCASWMQFGCARWHPAHFPRRFRTATYSHAARSLSMAPLVPLRVSRSLASMRRFAARLNPCSSLVQGPSRVMKCVVGNGCALGLRSSMQQRWHTLIQHLHGARIAFLWTRARVDRVYVRVGRQRSPTAQRALISFERGCICFSVNISGVAAETAAARNTLKIASAGSTSASKWRPSIPKRASSTLGAGRHR